MDVGARIRELRKARNLTAQELANMTNISQPLVFSSLLKNLQKKNASN
jgi:transcriptional regulator with XRE-family HTH domain